MSMPRIATSLIGSAPLRSGDTFVRAARRTLVEKEEVADGARELVSSAPVGRIVNRTPDRRDDVCTRILANRVARVGAYADIRLVGCCDRLDARPRIEEQRVPAVHALNGDQIPRPQVFADDRCERRNRLEELRPRNSYECDPENQGEPGERERKRRQPAGRLAEKYSDNDQPTGDRNGTERLELRLKRDQLGTKPVVARKNARGDRDAHNAERNECR